MFGVSERELDTGNNEWEISREGNRRGSCGTDGVWAEEHETGRLEQHVFLLMLIDTPSRRAQLLHIISLIACCFSVAFKGDSSVFACKKKNKGEDIFDECMMIFYIFINKSHEKTKTNKFYLCVAA